MSPKKSTSTKKLETKIDARCKMLRRTGSFGPLSTPYEWFIVHVRLGMSRKQSVEIVNLTIIDAHSAPRAQSLMHSTVEVRSAAQHRRCAAPQLDCKIRSGDSEHFCPGRPEKIKQKQIDILDADRNKKHWKMQH